MEKLLKLCGKMSELSGKNIPIYIPNKCIFLNICGVKSFLKLASIDKWSEKCILIIHKEKKCNDFIRPLGDFG